MKYRFRLEKALHFTRLKETVKKMELATTIQRIEFLRGRIEGVEKELNAILEATSRNPATAWAPYQTSKVNADTEELRRLAGVMKNEAAVLTKLREELSRLVMRRKAIESLKETRTREFELARSRKQQLEFDESFRLIPKKTGE